MNYCNEHPRGLGLDETGNWSGFKQSNGGATWSLEQTRTANTVNELTAINAIIVEQWANLKYDANGNMTSIPRPGLSRPSWANLTTDQWSALTVDDWARMEVAPKFQATYDAWNRLVKLTEPGATATDPVQENQYDGRGYRIVSKSYTAGTLTETRHAYFTDQWQCLEERLGTSTTSDRQFIWGVSYIDDLILRDRSVSGGTLNERLYALQDANWNVTTVTDSTGTIQERYEYEPYGVTTVLAPDFTLRTTSNFAWETTYCGYRWDSAIGLYSVRNRFYHQRLGVWLSRDPAEAELSLYDYVGAIPIDSTDPHGLDPLHILTPEQTQDLRELYADGSRYPKPRSKPLPFCRWNRQAILLEQRFSQNAARKAQERLANAATDRVRREAAKQVAKQAARARVLGGQLGRLMAARAVPIIGLGAAAAGGIRLGAAQGEAEFAANVNLGSQRAMERAYSQGAAYFEGVIGENIVSCPNFDEKVMSDWEQCLREFIDSLQSSYYIEAYGGNAANINIAAKAFEACLDAACQEDDDGC